MAALNRGKTTPYIVFAVLISTSVAVVAAGLPLENFLSEYIVSRNFPWYVAWRITVAEFLLWICSLFLNTFEEKISKPLLLSTSILFAVAHYYKLYIISPYTNEMLGISCRVSLYPIFYTYTCSFAAGFSASTLYLDIGQVLLIITFLILVPKEVLLGKIRIILRTFRRAL